VDEDSLRDELGIRRTLAAYCHLCDDGAVDELVALFTPDGAVIYGEQQSCGPEAIHAFFYKRQAMPEQRGKHLTMNTVVDIEGNRARALSDFLYLKFVDGVLTPHVTGRYRDELARVNGQWRFVRREILRLDARGS
jgi:hypothetical protein